MKTPAIRPAAALKTLTALTLIAALAALILYAALPVGATTHWVDYDSDDDGLIDIKTIAHLQAIRWDHDGNGALRSDLLGGSDGANYRAAFPNGNVIAHTAGDTSTRMGCPAACRGYELMNDLDFVNATTSQRNWTPPAAAYQYVGEFEGNGYTISNMIVNAPGGGYGGLFSILHTGGEIRNLGLIDPTVNVGSNGGALAGINRGTIIASYVSGGSVNTDRTTSVSGGLVGNNIGAIIAGYSTAAVTHSGSIVSYHGGGLAGSNSASGRIIASYAAGPVSTYTGSNTGGLVGAQSGSVTDSYCSDATGRSGCLTAAAMQAPTAYTGIYANWNVDLGNIDADNFPDNPWIFGTTTTYPRTKNNAELQAERAAPPVEDYDQNDNNLIDINNLHQLNAIRHDLNGDGLPDAAANYPAYAGAFVNGNLATTTPTATRMGCPQTCLGYELSQNLDFAADGATVTTTDAYPNWTPIGTYTATFDGNGNTISHLTITGGTGNYGLFSALSSDGVIRDVGMVDAALSGGGIAGALVGQNDGTVATSYAQGGSITTNLMRLGYVGGLVGYNQGADAIIRASWSTASVTSDTNMENGAGGLVGVNQGGTITAGFGAGQAAGYRPASLVSWVDGGTVTGACDLAINTAGTCIGELTQNPTIDAPGAATAQLQALTGYTGAFANLNADLDSDTFPDYPWSFGATTTYPTLYTPSERQTAAALVMDYDQDDDNLIDIRTLHQLNAIRYDLNGNGLPDNAANYSAYTGGFPNGNIADTSTPYLGCQSTCTGYELRMDLNFDMDGDGRVGGTTTSTDPYPNWQPITVGNTGYSAILEGNGRTIARLTLDRSNLDAGLFGELEGGTIRNVGMIDAKIRSGGNRGHGILVGYSNRGTVAASYAQGGSLTITAPSGHAGGLVGRNVGAVRYSYSTAAVNGGAHNNLNVGGLVGLLSHTSGADAVITASYAAGATTYTYSGPFPGRVGGLVGQVQYAASRVADSHCDTQATGQSDCIGGLDLSATAAAAGYTTAQLQTPAGYTGPYANWNLDLDSDTFPDYPWNFGTTTTYPTFKTPEQRQIAAPAVDYDQDDDNLIEIANLHQLNAIRYDLNGNGLPDNAAHYSAYTGGFPNGNIADTSTPYLGCQSTCIGYELTESLNFDMDGDGRVGGTTTSTDPYPNWTPIGPSPGYAATFDGNGRTITRLTITGNVRAGLFDTLASGGVIRDLGIIAPSVSAAPSAAQHMGVLTAGNGGLITASYVQGGSVTVTDPYVYAGGLSGGNTGTIQASYSTASVAAGNHTQVVAGGLVGVSAGPIIASYAAGPISGTGSAQGRGGLVGLLFSGAATITDSNCDTSVHNVPTPCVGNHGVGSNRSVTGNAHTTAELQSPTGYTNMYRNFNLDLDGDTFPDYPWDFGTTTTYPTLYTPTQRQTAAAVVVDYDQDDDNLIDITNLHQLNALRYDPDGNGLPDNAAHYSAYTGGFPNGNIADTGTPYMGCAATCTGYELMANLDFAADRVAVTSTDAYPNWTPIPSYESTLDGKGHTITRLTIDGADANTNAGLFAALTGDAVIRDLGLIAPTIISGIVDNANVGALVGNNAGLITTSYIDGGTVTVTGANPYAGGLAGQNNGDLRAVWSSASVAASATGGGLIGQHRGSLTASYAAGAVTGISGAVLGGLIGVAETADAAVTASYCDTTVNTQLDCIGAQTGAAVTAPGHPTAALKTPTDYTGIYEAWAITLTPGDNTRYNVWNFGEPTEYPTLYHPTDRQITITDTLPPPLPRTIPPEPEKPYNPAADHPEIYNNAEYEMTATCQTHNPDPETGNPQAATVTFDLGSYTGPILLHLSIWRNGRYMAYETQGIALPTLERDGQRTTLRVDTDPAQTRFRLDGRRHGLATNLVLGYADCRSDDP